MFKPQMDSLSELATYEIIRVDRVERLDGWCVELRHIHSSARFIHIACDDDNKAFAVAFATPPRGDEGTPHILEHLIFTGSRRYKLRSALSSILPRSLATYAGAMTGQTKTYYPFSTRYNKDFYNLLDFYLDAVFFPLLQPEAFLQEAWRLTPNRRTMASCACI